MSRQASATILKVVAVLFVVFVFMLSDKLISSGFLGALQGLFYALVLTLTTSAPGIVVGGGSYWLYKRSTHRIESGLIQNLIWWVSVIGGGFGAIFIGLQIGFLYIKFDSSLEGSGAMGMLLTHALIPGALGLAFGAGWGQGEKLM